MNCSGSLNYKIFPWTVTSKVKSAFSKIASTVNALKLYYQVKFILGESKGKKVIEK